MKRKPRPILIADDDEIVRRLLDHQLDKLGYSTVLAADGQEAIGLANPDLSCALIDLRMPGADGIEVMDHFKKHVPDVPVVIMSTRSQVSDAVEAMKHGALDYITKPFDLDKLASLLSSATRMGRVLQENRQLRQLITQPVVDCGFSGESAAAKRLLDTVARIAQLDSTVLITGESGVGKGLLARMIHQGSKRASAPFITTSCPALPRELIESEMFGHERGAFTGAQQRRLGRIEMAEGGTLFLDEIGDLPLLLQPKLLNVLQDRQFSRLGGSETIAADIRLIAATNADLQEKVAAKEFREDLYYRLNVIPIHIPPLRERLEDLPLLCGRILGRIARARSALPLEPSAEALAAMSRYSWPGNVRELENVLERASAFCDGPRLEPKDLPTDLIRVVSTATAGNGEPSGLAGLTLEELEKLAIRQTLDLCKGNKAAAARYLGITEKSIYNKMTRLGLR